MPRRAWFSSSTASKMEEKYSLWVLWRAPEDFRTVESKRTASEESCQFLRNLPIVCYLKKLQALDAAKLQC